MPEAGADPARRRAVAPLCRRHGGGDAGAPGGGQHVSVEGAQGAHPARGAADPLVLKGASRLTLMVRRSEAPSRTMRPESHGLILRDALRAPQDEGKSCGRIYF